jgi:hypothetical protein
MTSAPGRIDRCVGCDLELPLREALPDELGRVWTCVRCGAAYLAVISLSASLASLANVRCAGSGADPQVHLLRSDS